MWLSWVLNLLWLSNGWLLGNESMVSGLFLLDSYHHYANEIVFPIALQAKEKDNEQNKAAELFLVLKTN